MHSVCAAEREGLAGCWVRGISHRFSSMAAFTGLACHNIYVDANVHLRAHPALLVDSLTKWQTGTRVYAQPAGWISSDMTLLGLTLESALVLPGQLMEASHPLCRIRRRGG